MRKILDTAIKKIKNFDIFYQNLTALPVSFENNKLKNINESFKEGYGLRVINNNKIGFSSTTNLADTSTSDIDNLVDNAMETSRLGEKAYFKFPCHKIKPQNLGIYSKDIENLAVDEMIEWGNYYIQNLLKIDKKLKIEINVEKELITKRFVNSAGLDLLETKNILGIAVILFRAQENNFFVAYDYKTFKTKPNKKELESILNNIIFLYENSQNNVKTKKGYYQILFTPKAFSTLLSLFIQSFDGKLFYKKVSYFCNKINKKFTNKNIDILDDPFLKGYWNSTNFDGDGLMPEKIYLIKNGIVKNFSLDIQTAGKMKIKSNGHSARSFSNLPIPGFTNIIFNNNDTGLFSSWDNMIKQIDNGIIVDQFIGAGQSNIIGGEFSANVDLGFAVKNGKITGRVKNCMISGNFFDFFNNILKIEKKKYHYSRFLIPSILFNKISVNTDN